MIYFIYGYILPVYNFELTQMAQYACGVVIIIWVCVVQVVSLTARMTARVLVVLSVCWEGVRLFVCKWYKS